MTLAFCDIANPSLIPPPPSPLKTKGIWETLILLHNDVLVESGVLSRMHAWLGSSDAKRLVSLEMI